MYRLFHHADQVAFARLSGDANPMHLDAEKARFTQAGEPVVHGVHALLWALDTLAADGFDLTAIGSLRVQFHKFIFLNQAISLRVAKHSQDEARFELHSGELLVMSIAARLTAAKVASLPEGARDAATIEVGEQPAERAIHDLNQLKGWLRPAGDQGPAKVMFPNAVAALGQDRVVAIALTSTLVGMVCPGMHSIFSILSLQLGSNDVESAGLYFSCRTVDLRFRLVVMPVVGAALSGEVTAFVRAELVTPDLMAAIQQRVTPGQFEGRRALIIGGSRGLGAAAAKILAAGGAEVMISCVRSREEAQAVADDINQAMNREACTVFNYDAVQPAGPQLEGHTEGVTDFYYFATSKIFGQRFGVYSAEAFREFSRIYLDGFHDAVHCLLTGRDKAPLNIIYPSSIAVADRPKDMTEYAMAKAAGEILCADLKRAFPFVNMSTPRIPRVLTNQTATVPPVQAASATDVMLQIIGGGGPG
jgi:NAD(P)-dependent dehydrogenase (short-subunit alcohol dehydrogenase family)/acyl dehydratase